MTVRTRLQEIRKRQRVSAADLAHRVGVTRQTIYAIEDGSFVPNTAVSLRLSRALDVAVDEIFSLAEETDNEVRAGVLPGLQVNDGQLVRLCRIGNRPFALPASSLAAYLPAADGIAHSAAKRSISVRSPGRLGEGTNRLLLAGCDPALSLLQSALQNSGIEIVTIPAASRRALDWLKQGVVHAAGSHLLDRTTGDYNVPVVRRLLPKASVRVVTFASWEQGLIVQHGNPKCVRSIADLAGNHLRFVNREKGSGTRDLLDSELRRAGIAPEQVTGYNSIASGHLAAANAVATGNADCCIAPRSAARYLGLDFFPVATERFDLSFTRASLDSTAGKALVEELSRLKFRKKLQCIAGYDTTHSGDVLI